ncbi:MAG: hypothetical protein KKB23_01340 [Proteobacteria bacterium]|nr:hypothetical protein [Pseudomonadota bacterium]
MLAQALIKDYKLDMIYRIFRIFFAFPPARHLPAMLRNARRAGREPLRRGRRGRKTKSVNPLRGK